LDGLVCAAVASTGPMQSQSPWDAETFQHNVARLSQILELLAEDNRLNVYAGELEVRPPGAPTTGPVWVVLGRWSLK
jgi:hypothetical protein